MEPINGAGDGINILKNHGKSILFLSNNGIRSEASYLEKFANANIPDVSMVNHFEVLNYVYLVFIIKKK